MITTLYNPLIKEEALKEGIQKGIQKGIQEGIHLVAERMLKEGLDINTIVRFTGLEYGDVEKIKLKMKEEMRFME